MSHRGALMLNVTARQELMRTIVETLGVVVEEARLDFGEDGLSVRVVDPSHVAMIKMDVDSAAFDSWEVDETKTWLGNEKDAPVPICCRSRRHGRVSIQR